MKEYRIDQELQKVMPELSEEEYKELENSLLKDGFKGSPIIVWDDIIIDGHNRYEICQKHGIPYEIKELSFNNKEEVIQWMVRAQLGRRNLTPLQRIKLVETYRPIYEKQAKENKSANGGNKKAELEISPTPKKPTKKIDVREKLASDAGVSTNTYSKGKKILDFGNEELIRQVETGEKSINKAFKEIREQEQSVNLVSDCQNGNVPCVQSNTEQDETFKRNQESLEQIKQRYEQYLAVFSNDMAWLVMKDFIKDDEDVSSKFHSELQNCLEKFKGIKILMENMEIDDLDGESIVIKK